MRKLPISILVVCAAFGAAACGGTAASPSVGAPAGSPVASTSAVCEAVAEVPAAAVAVSIKDFTFDPDPVQAKLDQVIAWTNNDSTAHTASLSDGSCGTENIAAGATLALVFHAPGTYAYQCNIHSSMKGTIQIQ
jgi:plastocyanin